MKTESFSQGWGRELRQHGGWRSISVEAQKVSFEKFQFAPFSWCHDQPKSNENQENTDTGKLWECVKK